MSESNVAWARNDYSRVPYALYHDPEIYRLEQERIFKGRVWNYLCLEAEIEKPGDFITTWVGDTPVVVNRDERGALHGFENRCAHRGALVRRERRGNATDHTCIYHRWCYDSTGKLLGVPFQRGIQGKGGLSADFDKSQHNLRPLLVASWKGAVFGSFATDVEPLEEYLGPLHRAHIATVLAKPIEIIGYQKQMVYGNWKLYNENLRDTYHASLLHEFLVTFGLDRATQKGGVEMDGRHRHNVTYAVGGSDDDRAAKAAFRDQGIRSDHLTLHDKRMLEYRREFDDDRTMATSAVFPNASFQRLNNSLATRQIQPKGVDKFVLLWTYFGYRDDTPEMRAHRLRQLNLLGPGGLVSMEDSEAIEITQRATAQTAGASVIEVGGRGAIHDCDFRVTDVSVRGFWSYYAEVMGIEAPGGVR